MTNHEANVHTREDGVRIYEGRALAHQHEPVVDQGLQFDIGTLLNRRGMSRRGVFAVLGSGVATVGLAACSPAATNSGATNSGATNSGATTAGAASTAGAATTSAAAATTAAVGEAPAVEIPEETNGPYPADGSNGPDLLEQSGVVRSDIRSSFGTSTNTAAGVPMTLTLSLFDLSSTGSSGGAAAMAGAAVYIWHCTADGKYSMYSQGAENENYLRGVQVADSSGQVTFTSIFPGCYSGRWPHVHFEVYPDEASITDTANLLATSQVALPQDVCELVYATDGYDGSAANLAGVSLTSDNVFGEDAGEHQLGTATGDVTSGYAVALSVGIDPTTTPQLTGGGGPAPSR
ncbi:intradiol ring-cleavage dioxygenase [Propionibacteriaceae bacterium G57]|uniref:intradiol ring-cleavage dioxygenase n=1 Tax=Aestuariimicrobium sp. G57 TaxID=3418485 RepID=UPI003DA79978